MRTAEEHLRLIYNCTDPSDYLQLNISLNPDVLLLTKAINEARKECIRECADRFQIEEDSCYNNYITDESISSIINNLK